MSTTAAASPLGPPDWKSGPETVGDFIELLSAFPKDWPVQVATSAGGGIAVEHRDIKGKPTVAIFGKNGGRFGENPLTEEEYIERRDCFLRKMSDRDYRYTTCHGDHRMYRAAGGINRTQFGEHFDERVIDRMVTDGLLEYYKIPFSRDGVRRKP